jgi:purine-binding chemotaxis protein CheW
MSEAQITSLSSNDLVQNYLDSLLREVPDTVEVIEAESLVVHSSPIEPVLPMAPAATVTPVVEQKLADTPVPSAEYVVVDSASVQHDPRQARVVPEWGKQGFSGLVFEVAGLKMAAPLHLLGGICQLEDNLQSVVAQADWFMGLLRWNGKNLRVVDTARFVMPERLPDNSHREAYQSVVVLGDSLWALAVDRADESVHLQGDEIRWKAVAGSRPWLAGTLLERLCALIDVDTLLQQLEACDQTPSSDKTGNVALVPAIQ